ncbi:MAG: hypothetical protein GXP63_02950 [DPANN group archaeon]|nr:hypothetical protein [DPANN group archaeon]
MKKITLAVGLRIPDNTAFSALTTLRRLGHDELIDLRRMDYYEFEVDEEDTEDTFASRIVKTDIIVNANKHHAHLAPVFREGVTFIVFDREQEGGLLHTLRDRLGFGQLTSVRKGTLWQFFAQGDAEPIGMAEKAILELLYTPHYQEYVRLV